MGNNKKIMDLQIPEKINPNNQTLSAITPLTPKRSKKRLLIIISLVILLAIGLYYSYNKIIKPSIDLCSTHFNVCLKNSSNQWKIAVDTEQDFDLINKENLGLFFASSSILKFNDTKPGFTKVLLQGKTRQAYKDKVNGLTRIITGTKLGKNTLIILMTSEKDITNSNVQGIINKIKIW